MDDLEIQPLTVEEFTSFVDAWQDSEDKTIDADMAGRLLFTTAMLGTRCMETENFLICAVMAGAQKRGDWGAMMAIPKTAMTTIPPGTELKISEMSMPPMVELRVHLPKKPIVIANDFRRNGI